MTESSSPATPPNPPSTYLLSRETDWHSTVWLHGTRSSSLADIAKHGLRPRKYLGTQGNWSKHPSSPEMVYLTSCYGLHYARATEAAGLCTLVEFDISRMRQDQFFADEDSYALSTIEGMDELNALPVEKRVSYWRKRLERTDPQVSLRVLGNATYKGIIPAAAVKKVRLLTEREATVMTLQISDPVISPQNFKIMGGCAQRLHKWLLGYETDLNEWFDRVCKPSIPLMPLAEAVEYAARS